jgi:hypothetical protein
MKGWVNSKKLTPGEISTVVERIRRKYDEFISKFYKPKALREAFEARYIRALRAHVDTSSFLLAEISAIEELTKREEERIALGPARPAPEREPGFADKILEDNRRRIAKYPDAPFHKDAGEEVQKLLGALAHLEREHWGELVTALRDTAYSMNSSEMLNLDSQLHYLASTAREEIPQFLIPLASQLRKFPRNYAAIEREEKEYILQSAFFLNDLFATLERAKRLYTDMGDEEKLLLASALTYIWGIISDFRLKDFKRKRRWDRGEG